jgi:hypothetical protein
MVAVVVVIEFDDFPRETGWLIADADFDNIQRNAPYGTYPIGTRIIEEVVLLKPGKRYFFSIEDKFGNGLCCKDRKIAKNDEFASVGQYAVLFNGETIASGKGDFGFAEATFFRIPQQR